MRFTSITAAAVLAFCSSALATSALDGSENKMVTKRTPAAGGPTDVEILNYALTLEYLERDFYAEGLSKYSAADFKKAGFSQTVYDRFKMIGAQEKDHVAFLVSRFPLCGAIAPLDDARRATRPPELTSRAAGWCPRLRWC